VRARPGAKCCCPCSASRLRRGVLLLREVALDADTPLTGFDGRRSSQRLFAETAGAASRRR
jgi:hypothetical protein